MREIDVLEFLPDIMQQHAALECDRAQMRRQQGEGAWRQCRQETIESSGFELPDKRGCAIRHGACSYITARCGQHAVITGLLPDRLLPRTMTTEKLAIQNHQLSE